MSDKAILVNETGDPFAFEVTVREAGSETRHRVTLGAADAARFAAEPKALVEAAFAFLLDREGKESILARFDLGAIPRYFPEFAQELPGYLARR